MYTKGKLKRIQNKSWTWDIQLVDSNNDVVFCVPLKAWSTSDNIKSANSHIENQETIANTKRLALCWNTHDALVSALEEVIASADCGDYDIAWKILTSGLKKQRLALKEAKGE